VTEFDELADHYDETRGGEFRGAAYAAYIDRHIPPADGPILEIGVGTGVVALGLRRLGRAVIGLDLSTPMLRGAMSRLGPVLVRSDAMQMALATSSVSHAFSVWVVHSVKRPTLLFEEAFRVIRPGGLYVVCTTQSPASDDEVGRIIAGFTADAHQFDLRWHSKPSQELAAIAHRSWPALRELGEVEIEQATRPAIEALESLPEAESLRRASADVLVLKRS
jgi:ubiquinone/menaquinone biosynthesis C-methylase UbiE